MSGTDAPSVARRAEDKTDTKPPPSVACPRRQRRGCENGRGNRAKLQIEHSFRVKVYLEMVIHDIRLAWICGENLQRGGGCRVEPSNYSTASRHFISASPSQQSGRVSVLEAVLICFVILPYRNCADIDSLQVPLGPNLPVDLRPFL